jgi:hypothetical protein
VELFGAVDPTDGVADGGFGFEQGKRQAVDIEDEVGAAFGATCAEGDLGGGDVLVVVESVKVEQADGDVLVVFAEGHGAVAAQPGDEFFVGADESIAADGDDDGAQFVEDFVGAFGLGGDLGVEADEGFTQIGIDEHVVDAAGQFKRGDVMPARSLVVASERDVGRGGLMTLSTRYGWGCDSREQVDEVVFNGVLFVEHGFTLMLIVFYSAIAFSTQKNFLNEYEFVPKSFRLHLFWLLTLFEFSSLAMANSDPKSELGKYFS